MFRGGKILTLGRTLKEQQNLGKLCADRQPHTVEKFGGSNFYGVANIYKQYAGLPLTKPLPGIVLHGVSLHTHWVWIREANAGVPAVYCYPEFRREIYEKHGKKIILSASPFAYAAEMLKGQAQPERKGLIFFPTHSSHHITSKYNGDILAEKLSEFDDKYKPITICLYWKDYLLGAAKPFQERGFKVISAGHMFDKLFMYRFYHLCSTHKYASGCDIQSQIFYSVKAGCIYFTTEFPYHHIGDKPGALDRDMGKGGKHVERVREAFRNPTDMVTSGQKELVDYYLGMKYFKSRKGLRNDLLVT